MIPNTTECYMKDEIVITIFRSALEIVIFKNGALIADICQVCCSQDYFPLRLTSELPLQPGDIFYPISGM